MLLFSRQRVLGRGGRFGFAEGFGWKTVGSGLWTFFLGTGVTLWVLTVTVEICARLGNDEVQVHQTIEALKQSSSVRVMVVLVVQALVVAPVMEEVVFRGFFQSAMIQGMIYLRRQHAIKQPAKEVEKLPSPLSNDLETEKDRKVSIEVGSGIRWIAIAVTSLLFAGSHSISNWQHLPALWVLGVFLGYNYERRGTLAVPILIHMLFNALPIVVTMVGK